MWGRLTLTTEVSSTSITALDMDRHGDDPTVASGDER